MKKLYAVGGAAFVIIIATVWLLYFRSDKRHERLHYEREETELIISNIPGAHLTLFKAGKDLQDAVATPPIGGERFLIDPHGYSDDANWTEAGRRWKSANASHTTALLKATDVDFKRFGQPDQPVVQVNWFEANAFCHWLTKSVGAGRWIFALPSEAEWEKAARGPDNFDYGLGMNISDNEVQLYNWKKNPGAEVTVVGLQETKSKYQANRYGVYHMTGNVTEWTQSIYRAYNRQHRYVDDDDRNKDELPGERVLRGGSWYTASIAVLYIPYRENFQPEVQTPYLGFRVVARPVP
jgi:formylglycine-generating enzyme required for sulfatase activity